MKPTDDWKLYGCLLVATLNSCINGYDGSLMGSINSYPQYRSYFGFPLESGTPSTGIVYAIYTIGNLVGSFAAGPATDTFGMPQSRGVYSLILTVWRSTSWHAHRFFHYRYWNNCPSYMPQPRWLHGRSIRSWVRRRYQRFRRPHVCIRDIPPIFPGHNDCNLQHFLVRWWHPRDLYPIRNIINLWQHGMEDPYLDADGLLRNRSHFLLALA